MPPRTLVTKVATHLTQPENLERLKRFFDAEYETARKLTDGEPARQLGRTLDLIDAAISGSATPKATGTTSTGGDAPLPKTARIKP